MSYRKHVNKRGAAKRFRAHVGHTKKINLAPPLMRGGIRL